MSTVDDRPAFEFMDHAGVKHVVTASQLQRLKQDEPGVVARPLSDAEIRRLDMRHRFQDLLDLALEHATHIHGETCYGHEMPDCPFVAAVKDHTLPDAGGNLGAMGA